MKEESKKLYLDTYFKLNPQLKSKGTIKGKRHLITTFLKYLDGLGISGLNELTRENVYDFMNTFLHIRELVTYYPTRTVFDLLQMRQLL